MVTLPSQVLSQPANFVGNGQGLTNINVSETGWSQVNEAYAGAGNTGIYAFGSGDVDIARVGIGTSVPHFALDLGDDSKAGTGLTNLVVRNKSSLLKQSQHMQELMLSAY